MNLLNTTKSYAGLLVANTSVTPKPWLYRRWLYLTALRCTFSHYEWTFIAIVFSILAL